MCQIQFIMLVALVSLSGCVSLNQSKVTPQDEKPDYCVRPVLEADGVHITIPFVSGVDSADGMIYRSHFLGLEILNVVADGAEVRRFRQHINYNMIESSRTKSNGSIVYLISSGTGHLKNGWCLNSTADLRLKKNIPDDETNIFMISKDVHNVLITYRICFPSGDKSPIRKVLLMEVDKIWNQPWSASVKKDAEK